MKRVFSVLAIIFCTVQLFASELVIRGEVDVPFSVYINGEKYYSYYSQVTISNLIRGVYRVEIYTETARQELLYDCRIDVPRNSRVVATFTGDNHIYVSSNRYTKPVTIVTVAYPHRVEHHTHVVHSEPVRVAPKGQHKPAPVKPATSSNNKSGVHGEVRSTNSTRSSKPASSTTSTTVKTSTEKSASTRTSSSSSSNQVKSSSSTSSSSSSNGSTRSSSTRSSSSSSSNNTGSRTTQSTR